MTKETMTVHKALAEIKILKDRIQVRFTIQFLYLAKKILSQKFPEWMLMNMRRLLQDVTTKM